MSKFIKKKYPSGRTPRFIQPCILLLLYRNKSHGYELIDNLKSKGFVETNPDPGIVYRILRKFEKEGLVVSKWIENDKGPSKRLYQLTAFGEKNLKDWGELIQIKVNTLNNFIHAFKKIFLK